METLKSLRKQNKIKQDDMAKTLNLARSTYQSYEYGVAEPDINTLIKMADFFDVSLDYLCGRPNNNLIFTDSLSPNKKQLIDMIKNLSEDETLIAIGWVARLTNKPIDDILKKVK